MAYPGVDTIHAVDYTNGFDNEVYTTAIAELFHELEPRVLLLPHTVRGLDYEPAVASELNLPILTKMTGVSGTEPLNVVRKAYNSTANATVAVDSEPVVSTVWEGEFEPVVGTGEPADVEDEFGLEEVDLRSRLLKVTEEGDDDIDITTEDFIIAIGRGIDEEENLDLVREACEELGATLAGSRPLIESVALK